MTQRQLVINHLQKYGSITSKEAIDRYGITRLADVIYQLKHKDGYIIGSQIIQVKNRYGQSCYVSRYTWND